MNIRLVILGLVLHFSGAFGGDEASTFDYVLMSPLTGIGPAVAMAAGHCPGTKIPPECKKLKPVADRPDSFCCPTCDVMWSPTMTAYLEVASDPTPANVYLASMRTLQLGALAAAGSAGAIPILGDSAANPANAMVTGLDMILPQHMSPEVQCMREQFAKMQDHMVQMEQRILEGIENLKKKVEAQNFYAEYMAIRQKKKVLEGVLGSLNRAIQREPPLCTYGDRNNCNAVKSWLNHCKSYDAGNQHDPHQLILELKNLVTGNFLGQTFLGAATSADSSTKHFLEIYMAINSDVMDIVMLNTKCAATLNNTKSNYIASVEDVNHQVQEIKNHMARIVNERVQKELTEQTAKLVRETKQFNNFNDLKRALEAKEKTTHSSLLSNYHWDKDVFPFFRTHCVDMKYQNEKAKRQHDGYAMPFHIVLGDNEMNVVFNTTPYIHLTDYRSQLDPNQALVCYTHVPSDVQSAINDVEFKMCIRQYFSGQSSGICKKWEDQIKLTMNVLTELRTA